MRDEERLDPASPLIPHPSPLQIGILLSGRGRGSNMQAIIEACHSGLIPGDVVRVVSTSPGAPALERARAAGVDALFVDPTSESNLSNPISVSPCLRGNSPSESSLDARLLAAFREAGADTIALAGFMRKLGPVFLRAFPQRILNIHAALLPCFGGHGFYGRRVHEAVIESGARFSGATVHFADDEYDHGPIVLQAVVPVEDDDTPDTLAARVLEQEHRIYPEALRLLAEGRLEVVGRRVKIRPADGTPPPHGGQILSRRAAPASDG
jgi:phosphoribosylglycinamide formyltransferase 1